MKEFDLESLAQFNGKEGHPCYIAHKGKVFDVSSSKLWNNGLHMKRHAAGHDLTIDIEAAPHGPEKLDLYAQVGVLKISTEAEENLPKALEALLERFPFLRRHPHPMLVHFPIAFTISPAIFYLLYLITDVNAFETTALYCLGAGILFSVPAILTGFLAWWINYQLRPMRPVLIKIVFSVLLVTISLAAFLLRIILPDMAGIVYLILLLVLIPVVSVIGWYGASLTFPLERK
ncbi:MAG: cytochrome b5 [Deltaproteobacteria bacterium HGW-Deltaproteobacteria-1]|jgi:predicted heme/steroid binding protein/uncharacterized membrane protein|nr:MAG: cytochrome b5 [Deltaproteobacteria bacterium HGW-Deltaproteobacteria-1]